MLYGFCFDWDNPERKLIQSWIFDSRCLEDTHDRYTLKVVTFPNTRSCFIGVYIYINDTVEDVERRLDDITKKNARTSLQVIQGQSATFLQRM